MQTFFCCFHPKLHGFFGVLGHEPRDSVRMAAGQVVQGLAVALPCRKGVQLERLCEVAFSTSSAVVMQGGESPLGLSIPALCSRDAGLVGDGLHAFASFSWSLTWFCLGWAVSISTGGFPAPRRSSPGGRRSLPTAPPLSPAAAAVGLLRRHARGHVPPRLSRKAAGEAWLC